MRKKNNAFLKSQKTLDQIINEKELISHPKQNRLLWQEINNNLIRTTRPKKYKDILQPSYDELP